MKKTYFRIELCEGATFLCDTIVSLAAKANGGKSVTIEQMKTVADGNLIQYPSLNDDVVITLVDDKILIVDRKIGDNYKTVCRIEQVEIYEIVKEDENGDDLPEEMFMTPGICETGPMAD